MSYWSFSTSIRWFSIRNLSILYTCYSPISFKYEEKNTETLS